MYMFETFAYELGKKNDTFQMFKFSSMYIIMNVCRINLNAFANELCNQHDVFHLTRNLELDNLNGICPNF